MLNLTLTITAAPELLAAMSTFTNAITAAKVVTIPENTLDFITSKEQIAGAYKQQMPSVQQTIPTQQTVQPQVPTNDMNLYNQPNNVPGSPMNNQLVSVPVYPVQTQQQSNTQTAPAQGITVPTTAQTYTMEQLAVASTQIVDAGRRTELVALLSSFGVQALTALPKDKYGAFATLLRALGAKI